MWKDTQPVVDLHIIHAPHQYVIFIFGKAYMEYLRLCLVLLLIGALLIVVH